MDFFETVAQRHSIRKFENRIVEDTILYKILSTIDAAPSGGDLQGYEVVVVRDEAARRAISEAAHGQESVAEAMIVMVFCADHLLSGSKYGRRGAELYSIQDATIAAAYSQLAATALGLSSVWVGAFDPAKVSQVIAAPEEVTPVAMIPIGYPAEEAHATPRRPLDEPVRQDKF